MEVADLLISVPSKSTPRIQELHLPIYHFVCEQVELRLSSKVNHMPLNLPLMRNNISRVDLDAVIDYLNTDNPILTQSTNVNSFEKEWSDWLGVKHSVFVNSGSSANQLTMAALRLRYPEGGDVIILP